MNQHMPLTRRPARRSSVGVSPAPVEVLEDAPRTSAVLRHDLTHLQITRPTPIQAKLTVGAAYDPAEHEADTMAAHVMRNLHAPAPQSAHEETDPVQRAPEIRRSGAGLGAFDAGPEVEAGIQSARGGGQSLPATVSGQMGQAFGADFSGVRVHADSHADGLSRSIQAKAFTTGNDIFFSQGTYSPASRGGQELLAHELTHVVQQGGGAKNAAASRSVLPPIRRWDLSSNTIPFQNTTNIRVLPSGRPVFFLDDASNDTLVVKGEDAPIGMSLVYSALHQKIHGTPTVKTGQMTSGGRAAVMQLLNNPALTSNDTWTALGNTEQVKNLNWPGVTPADHARHHQQEQVAGLPKMQVMEYATGKTAGEQSKLGGQLAQEGDVKSMRQLLSNKDYITKLGSITAVDLFLENADRVLSGNVGNWINNADDSMTLLDNIDSSSRNLWTDKENGNVGRHDLVDKLATSRLTALSKECIRMMLVGMDDAGDSYAVLWADTAGRVGTPRAFMEQHFLAGLKQGRSNIIKLLNTNKMSKVGRVVKNAVKSKQSVDKSQNDIAEDQTSYWDRLKARARYLKRLG